MIHSIKKRLIRERVKRESAYRVETRDGIVWDIIPAQRICRVKIQGSDRLIEARYPENRTQTPQWLKPGNSVKIMHTGGNRNSVEVVGHGLFVPTPVTVDGVTSPAAPDIQDGPDCVLTGCMVRALPDSPAMQVYVTTGTYRISGVVYDLAEMIMVMSETSNIDMSSGIPMGSTAGVVDISAASSTMFRLDSIAVGTDGVIDVVEGTPSLAPELPDTPASHVLLGHVLIPPGTTEIEGFLINASFIEPSLSSVEVTPNPTELDWETGLADFTVKVLDQYGNPMTDATYHVDMRVSRGTGALWMGDGIYSIYPAYGEATVRYYRVDDYDGEVDPPDEESPVVIDLTVVEEPDMQGIAVVLLMNSEGGYIL